MRSSDPADAGTIHDWPLRRRLVASSLQGLGADLVALQEASPVQALDLEDELGPGWGVKVDPCNATAWAGVDPYNAFAGPSEAEARAANGVAWRKDRLCFISASTFWLCNTPDSERNDPSCWGGSGYHRSVQVSKFTDLFTGKIICLFSCHFDHDGDDSMATGGASARRESAALLMTRALTEQRSGKVDVVLVAGDFATFEDRSGACYSALTAAGEDQFVDVRDVRGALIIEHGRGGGSWEGWETDQWCRANVGGEQRYSQIFVGATTPVFRTGVPEERFALRWRGQEYYVYASDNLPVVADIGVPASKKPLITIRGLAMARAPKTVATTKSLLVMGLMAVMILLFVGLLVNLMWDLLGQSVECRFQCRDRKTDPPFDAHLFTNLSCATVG